MKVSGDSSDLYLQSSYGTLSVQSSTDEEQSEEQSVSSIAASLVSSESSLSAEEELYDLDNDGELSASEEAAYLKAKQDKEALENQNIFKKMQAEAQMSSSNVKNDLEIINQFEDEDQERIDERLTAKMINGYQSFSMQAKEDPYSFNAAL